jgi:hypothetical protein
MAINPDLKFSGTFWMGRPSSMLFMVQRWSLVPVFYADGVILQFD